MFKRLAGLTCGVLLGLVVVFFVLVGITRYREPYTPTHIEAYREGQGLAAYASFKSDMERREFLADSYQAYDDITADYEGNGVWHFVFFVILNDKKITYDVRYQSLPDNRWGKPP